MRAESSARAAAVGVAEHGNSAVLVTLGAAGELLDRRRIDLTRGLPTHPYHHEGSWAVGRYADSPWAKPISLEAAIALVDQVQEAARAGAREALAALATELAAPIGRIALRDCPPLPPSTREIIADARAATMADSVMYRRALAEAADARGWDVRWYDRDHVAAEAGRVLRHGDLATFLTDMGRLAGPPWQAKQKLAATAALVALGALSN